MVNYARLESLKKTKGVRDALAISLQRELQLHVGESVATTRTEAFLKLHGIVSEDTLVTTSVLREILSAM